MKFRKLKRAAGIVLSMALVLGSLAGCSGGGAQESGDGGAGSSNQAGSGGGKQAMGRFLEEDVTLPIVLSTVYDMKKLEDGTIRILGDNGDNGARTIWDSKDSGVNWEKAFDVPAEIQDQGDGYVDHAALSSDGQSIWAYNKIEDDAITQILYLVSKDGEVSQVPFELPDAKGGSSKSFEDGEETGDGGAGMVKNMVLDLCFLDPGQVLLKDISDIIYQINVGDGSVAHTYDFSGAEDTHQIYMAGNKLVVATSTEVLVYDTETGEQQQTEEALQKSVSESGMLTAVDTVDAGESIYCLTGNGLYHYKFGGSVMEQLIDGTMNTLGAPAFYPIALTMLDEENYMVAATDLNSDALGGITLLRYTWSADTPAKPDKELKVYSLYNNRELRQSVSQFQKEHTDVYVNYQVAMSEENGMTVSDALKTLTTEIMAGKGPDLMLLDGMPIKTYMEKGILKDITSLFQEDSGSYFENIRKAYQDSEGKMYAAPARFFIPMAQGGGAYYTPGEDFASFTSKQGVLANMQPETVVEKFWYSCGASWQKEDNTLDAEKVTEFLSQLKNAYGEYDSSAIEDTTAVAISEGGAVNELQKVSLSWGDFDLAFGRVNVNVGLYGRMDYGMLDAVNKKLGQGDYGLMPGQAEGVFVPAMVIGVSSKSAQPETAEAFVKYLFSPQAQKVSQLGGFPVEKESFRSMVDGHEYDNRDSDMRLMAGGSAAGSDEMLSYEMVPTPEEDIQKITKMVESFSVPALQDDVIKESVVEQGAKVLKGELSPEEATDAIMQKVNIYLAE